MIELTDNEKYLIRRGSEYLKKNNLKNFYVEVITASNDYKEVGHITQFFMGQGIDVMGQFTTIPNYMFYGADIESIEIPDNITRIGKHAFEECKKLKNVRLSDTLKAIEQAAFRDCSELERVFLPDSVTIIGAEAFKGCDKVAIFANKRTGANRLRCKQNEIEWYRDHLFVNEEASEGGE